MEKRYKTEIRLNGEVFGVLPETFRSLTEANAAGRVFIYGIDPIFKPGYNVKECG